MRESMWKVSEGLAGSASSSEATNLGSHNHDPSEHAAIHATNLRPTAAEEQEILRLGKGTIIPSIVMGTMVPVLTGKE